MAAPFLNLLFLLFHMLRFGLLLAVFLSFFPHAVALVAYFCSSSAFFRLLQLWLSLPLSLPLFSLLRLLLLFLVFIPVFPHPAPPAALCFWRASYCLLCCRVSVGGSSVVRVLLSLCFCSFSIARFSPPASLFIACPSGCILSLGVCSSSCWLWCSSLWLRFFLHRFCLALFGVALWFSVVFRLVRIPGSRRDVVSLWDESGLLRPLFFSVLSCLHVMVSFLFLSSLRSSALFASGVLLVLC